MCNVILKCEKDRKKNRRNTNCLTKTEKKTNRKEIVKKKSKINNF